MFSGIRNRIHVFGLVCLAILLIGISAVRVNAYTHVNFQADIPLIYIEKVVRNESVTISGSNFPVNQTFTVRMGEFGSRGIQYMRDMRTRPQFR